MADHININHPNQRAEWLLSESKIASLEAELSVCKSALKDAQSDLASIFTRIRNGEPVELNYPDGIVLIATKGRQRGASAD